MADTPQKNTRDTREVGEPQVIRPEELDTALAEVEFQEPNNLAGEPADDNMAQVPADVAEISAPVKLAAASLTGATSDGSKASTVISKSQAVTRPLPTSVESAVRVPKPALKSPARPLYTAAPAVTQATPSAPKPSAPAVPSALKPSTPSITSAPKPSAQTVAKPVAPLVAQPDVFSNKDKPQPRLSAQVAESAGNPPRKDIPAGMSEMSRSVDVRAHGSSPMQSAIQAGGKEASAGIADVRNVAVNEHGRSSTVRTLQSDIADVLKSGKVSKADVVLAEERRRRKRGTQSESTPEERKADRKSIIIGWSALSLLVIGIGVVSFAFFESRPDKQTVTVQPPLVVPRLIFVSEQQGFDITGKDREEILKNFAVIRKMFDLRLNTIAQIYIVRDIVGIRELVPADRFLSDIAEHMPSALGRSLTGEYMYGIHAFNGNTPFLILKIEFFENAFASMLRWEKDIVEDIMPIFGVSPVPAWMFGASFEDMTYKNRDIRVIRDQMNEAALIYAFTDRGTLLITTDIDTFDEVAARLVTPVAR
ncbi:MAG: hypothetical protein COW88_01230 [Candidatus Lloydbacteria bacterium CG22_combo_CG10-13_8_21_14_all_47_15]|uniref:Uncharacterized protein n=1 Tax=Candidatus Lloydbacteria bacterium CG22_combo_CG10-13_8_21_14_all_47_15 TaxID=1974635 RepID=A0A2H0CW10_9BACT|nr:MAG: hypothetical protein COW88_01230 [Candidatus Lloydbacteria bacterium CG22_combo_CG10-13_8_21_14_all_47_15]